ncbi:MAG: RNA polymerase sigma factor [Terriglobales bacterium]
MPVKAFQAAQVKSLYEKHGSALAAYLCCGGMDFAAAEDVVQQVFLKLLEGNVSMPQMPAPYLYRAVRNAGLNYRRKAQREVNLPDDDQWLVATGGRPDEVLAVQRALRELPEEQRETVFLKIWGGLTLQEIGELLEIPINTAASRYRYAIEKLREHLKPLPER